MSEQITPPPQENRPPNEVDSVMSLQPELTNTEALSGREQEVAVAGALAVETAFSQESTPSDRYSYELSDVYSFAAAQNRERNTPINQEIATQLKSEAKTLLEQGLSGSEIADMLGRDTAVKQRADQLLYDMGKDLPGREEPLEAPVQPWDSQEYVDAKFAVIDELQEELVARNKEYKQLTEDLLENGFSYRDVLGESAVRAGTGSERPENAVMYAHELARLNLMDKGEEVSEATQDIRRRFDDMRSLLPESVRLSPYADSESWVLWDIAKQETLKDKDYRSTVDEEMSYSGSTIANPESEDAARQVELIRDVIAWRHLGWEMHLKAFNGEDVSWLDSLLDDTTKDLLHKVGNEAHQGQLSSSEYADLGRGIEAGLRREQAQSVVRNNPGLQAELEARSRQVLEDMAKVQNGNGQ